MDLVKYQFFLRTNHWSWIVVLFLSLKVEAQEIIPVYSDYLTDNLFLLHPSLAGAAGRGEIRLTARQQWFDVENAPGLQTFTINGRIGENEGLGAIVFNDQNGNFSRTGAYASYAYHLRIFGKDSELHRLSFGMSAGVVQHSLDQSQFSLPDPILGNGTNAAAYANMDIGMSYFKGEFYTHFSARNVLPVNRELLDSENISVNQRKYHLTSGYIFSPSYDWYLEPSAMLQLSEATLEKMLDLNIKAYRDFEFGQLWIGLSYRQGFGKSTGSGQNLTYVTPFGGIEFKNFVFGYTYSRQFNEIVLSGSGYHQITLGYNFGATSKSSHCWCPALN